MAYRIPVRVVEQNEGQSWEDILNENMFGTRVSIPALCSEGCEVEVDGRCEHGYPSLAMALGVV